MSNIDAHYNLEDVKKTCNLSKRVIDEVVEWFFGNGYTFRNSNFPKPLQKVIGDKFNLDIFECQSMTTILMYEDIIRTYENKEDEKPNK
jgi:hypothetical protein